MKNKIVYLFIISMMVVSCRKDEEKPYNYTMPEDIWATAYIRGYVKDSATNLPLQGVGVGYSSTNTNVNGRYVGAVRYNINPKFSPPYFTIVAITNNKIGWVNIANYNLIPNDTITAPNIYAIPASFVKLHVKDTAMATSSLVQFSFNYEYSGAGGGSFSDTVGHYTDTTFFQLVPPREQITLYWQYKRGGYWTDSWAPYINLPAGDTIAENVFY